MKIMAFIHKYKPKKIKDIFGQDKSIYDLIKYITKYNSQKSKAALLYGPTGTGKTSSVYTISQEYDLEIIEVNSSDFRNKDKINQVIGNALKQGSLFGRKKIILIDEIDGLSGRKDRGALQEVIKLMKESKYPIILTATNPFDNKLSSIRNKSQLIAFKELDYKDIYEKLKQICNNENIEYEENSLKSLARMSSGDMRSAINDLEGIAANNNKVERKDIMELDSRNKTESMPQALVKILKNSNPIIAKNALDNVEEDLDHQFLWIDKNTPLEYDKPKDLARAYYYISKADIYKRRIRRWQHWRFIVYIKALLSAGIAVSKDKKYDKFITYKPTGRLLKIFWANRKKIKKVDISKKIALKTHQSSKEVLKNFEYYKTIIKTNKSLYEEFKLGLEEIKYIEK
ncbi:MAG: replication factor C large subunit [Nanoarchaeota archaeon]